MKKASVFLATIILATLAQAQSSTMPIGVLPKPTTCYGNVKVVQLAPYIVTFDQLTKKELKKINQKFQNEQFVNIVSVYDFGSNTKILVMSVDASKLALPIQSKVSEYNTAIDLAVNNYIESTLINAKVARKLFVIECNEQVESFPKAGGVN